MILRKSSKERECVGLGIRDEQRFLTSIRTMACAGGIETLAHDLISLYFREFMMQLRVEKGALFRIMENEKAECLARYGMGDSVITLLMTDLYEKLPDLRFYQATAYRAQEMLLARSYLIMGDAKTKIVYVAYNTPFHSKAYRWMKRKESRWYYEVFASYLVRALKQVSLEHEVGRGELSGLRGFRAFCAEYEKIACDAFALFKISDMSLLYESLKPGEIADCVMSLAEKISGALKVSERAYHVGDSYFILCLIGEKWDVYQRVKLLLSVLNDILCSKRPLSCPDMDVRVGLIYSSDGREGQLVNQLFGCVKKAGNGATYVYGQLNGDGLDETCLSPISDDETEYEEEVNLLQCQEIGEAVVPEISMVEKTLAPEPEECRDDSKGSILLDAARISRLLGINYGGDLM